MLFHENLFWLLVSHSIFVQPICENINQLKQINYIFLIFFLSKILLSKYYLLNNIHIRLDKVRWWSLGFNKTLPAVLFNETLMEGQTKAKERWLGIFPDTHLGLNQLHASCCSLESCHWSVVPAPPLPFVRNL